jgi:hypothetical protein
MTHVKTHVLDSIDSTAACYPVHVRTCVLPWVLVALVIGCKGDPSMSETAETGSGDGDGDAETETEGDGDGDGDGDNGDGDGPGDGDDGPGDGDDGDGDGDNGDGDGDGDDCCQSQLPQDFPDCGAVGAASVESTVEGALEGQCTVTSVEAGPPTVLAFECPMGPATITLEVSPAWVPTLAVDASVLAEAESNVGGAKGSGYTYRRWQLRDPDTDAVLMAYTYGELVDSIDDFLAPDAIVNECHMVCEPNGFDGSRRAAVQFDDGVDQVVVFQGNTATIGDYDLWVGHAYDYPLCATDQPEGLYTWFAAAAP